MKYVDGIRKIPKKIVTNKNKEKIKKSFSLLLVLSLIIPFSLLPNLSKTSAFSGSGEGTEGSPFIITTCEQLQEVGDDLTVHYRLGGNIDCSETSTWNPDGDGDYYGFEPIGNYDNRFEGNFDGNNYVITDLYIERLADDYIGLFGVIGEGSEVYNLGLENIYVAGYNNVGALAGALAGTVTNVYSTGQVIGDSIVGGLVGLHSDSSLYNSSPLVYTWNGEKYTYVADVGNMLPRDTNGIDLAQIDNWNLVPKNNKYSMKISEEYNEIVYFDELALMAFDHQPGYTVIAPLDRNTDIGNLITISDNPTNPLLSCVDMYGNDCLEDLKNYDDKWNYKDESFVNSWILDFGDLSNKDNIQLIMRGARDYAAGTSGKYEKMRDIEVKDQDGNWVSIYDRTTLGSDGTPRLRTIDLTNKFLSDDYHVKVTFGTMNVNYFAVDTSPQVSITVNTYHPTKADLSFRGFTEIDNTYYNNHDYDKLNPFPEDLFTNQYGNFTKYGDVSPLLSSTNDQFVIMRYGDHMDIEFPYEEPADGLERSFILYNNALYKHATNDDIGILGQTVDPLPYQGMTEYTENTEYPMTQENVEYLNEWNTREYEGKILSRGSTIINSYSEANVYGRYTVGGLVGSNSAGKLITGSYATGNVSYNPEFWNSYSLGGLVGSNGQNSRIENSYATGNVTGHPSNSGTLGGLVGWGDNDYISNSYATGLIEGHNSIGGLVGSNSFGEITNSYSTGNVSGFSDVGGLIGGGYNIEILNSYSVGNVSGSFYTGGFIGDFDADSGLYTDYIINSGWYASEANNGLDGIGSVSINGSDLGGQPVDYEEEDNTVFYSSNHGVYALGQEGGSDFENVWEEQENDYPKLVRQESLFTGGSGIEIDPYQISTCQQLQNVRYFTDGYYFILNNDINCSDTINWNDGAGFMPIGDGDNNPPFQGNLDGNNHKIINLYINRGLQYAGLFGIIVNSTISNVGLEDVNITNTSNFAFSGGLAGIMSESTIQNSYVTGSISGVITGGLVGANGGMAQGGDIYNSYTKINLSGVVIGGLVGFNSGYINNSFSIDENLTPIPNREFLQGFLQIDQEYIVGGLVGGSVYQEQGEDILDYVSNSGWYKSGNNNLFSGIGAYGYPDMEFVVEGINAEPTYVETDNTVFYSRNHGVYAQGQEGGWGFDGNPWYEYSNDYPKFTEQKEDSNPEPSRRSHSRSSGISPQVIASFQAEQLARAIIAGVDLAPYLPANSNLLINLNNLDNNIFSFSRILKYKMVGEDVRQLQNYLNAHGYNCGIVDGVFGIMTKQAVIEFQLANSLVSDGVVGLLTKEKIK